MSNWLSILKKFKADAGAVWDEGILRPDGEISRFRKFIHFWVLVVKSFYRNRCPTRAAALSYTTLFALIPMLAVAISVTSSLLKSEGEQEIYRFIDKFVSRIVPSASVGTNALPAQSAYNSESASGTAATNAAAPAASESAANTNTAAASPGPRSPPAVSHTSTQVVEAQKEAARRIHEFIQRTRSGAIAGVGMLFLVYMAFSMFRQIEGVFDDIWGVMHERSWFLRIVTYWATMTLGPLLLAVALGLASGPYLKATQNFFMHVPILGSVVSPALALISLWLMFALFYKAVPNTKVHFGAAFIGGIVGGTAWYLNGTFGFLYASRVVTNSRIYGSLGLVPVFMMGIYLSWFILLFGAQVAYAFQNRSLYLQEKLAESVNQRGREFVALRLLTCVGQRFQRGMPPATVAEMSRELGIPSRLVQQVLQILVATHLVIEISGAEAAYTPARPLDTITAHHVLMALRVTPGQEITTRDEPVREEVYGEFARIQAAEKTVASSVTLLALVNQAQARLGLTAPQPDDDDLKLTHALIPPSPKTGSGPSPSGGSAPTKPPPHQPKHNA